MARRHAAPAAQRKLKPGVSGGDVLAVQRAVRKALRGRGHEPTCGTSGNYGTKTQRDVQRYQHLVGLRATGNVGEMTLHRLWNRERHHRGGAFDDYGVQLLFRVPIGRPAKVPLRKMREGQSGPAVQALQRMLWRALGGDSENTRSGRWGDKTTADLRRFLNRANWQQHSARKVGSREWEALWPFGDALAHKLARKALVSKDDEVRHRIRSWGEWFVQNRGRISYAQVRPYPRRPVLPLRTDCSGSATAILRWAGCPNDPHGRGWDGLGFTGTMQGRGRKVSLGSLLPGDCVFYGNQGGGVSSHVVIVIGPGDRAMTFGHNPPEFVHISSYWRANLRTDIGARRYF